MKPDELSENHIAPCGMNCALCMGFQREKKKCLGCNIEDPDKPGYCKKCFVVICEKRKENTCCNCKDLPCKRIKQLDKRYTAKYHMSMMENLEFIREKGMDAFLEWERKRWTCPNCGDLISVHRENCMSCGEKWVK